VDLSQVNTVSTLSSGFALKLQYVWLVKFDFFPGNFQTLRSPCTFAKMEILSGWWTKRHVRTQIPLVRSKIGSFCYIFSEIFNFYKFLATSCFFISCHKSWALLCYSAVLSSDNSVSFLQHFYCFSTEMWFNRPQLNLHVPRPRVCILGECCIGGEAKAAPSKSATPLHRPVSD